MVLSGVGDALGYKQGDWEFCHSGETIHEELEAMGGLQKIKVNTREWPVSDDTVMHLATADALVTGKTGDELYLEIAKSYIDCMDDMGGRAPGPTCMNSVQMLRRRPKNFRVPFNERGGGCGAAMRAMCIGLLYQRPEELDKLIEVSVESGRMTHNHPTGYLGAVAAALFTAYSIQRKPIKSWGKGLMDTLPEVMNYIKKVGVDVDENEDHWGYFSKRWTEYLKERGISDGETEPRFPDKFGIKERDDFYQSCSFSGWGGSSGHDAPMIAYDALLSYDGTWEDLCSRAMFHGGDSDSTGVIAGACYGAMFGFEGVPPGNYKKLEYLDRLKELAKQLYKMVHPVGSSVDGLTDDDDKLPETAPEEGRKRKRTDEEKLNGIEEYPTSLEDTCSSTRPNEIPFKPNAASSEANAGTAEQNSSTSEAIAGTTEHIPEQNACPTQQKARMADTNADSTGSTAVTDDSNAGIGDSNAGTGDSNATTTDSNAGTGDLNAATTDSNTGTGDSNVATTDSNDGTTLSHIPEQSANTTQQSDGMTTSDANQIRQNSGTTQLTDTTQQTDSTTEQSADTAESGDGTTRPDVNTTGLNAGPTLPDAHTTKQNDTTNEQSTDTNESGAGTAVESSACTIKLGAEKEGTGERL